MIQWLDKDFWEKEFLDNNKRFNIKKAEEYFKRSRVTIYKQLKKLKIVYKKNKQAHITNFEKWEDKEFWEREFLTTELTFDDIKAKLYFNISQSKAYTQFMKFGIKFNYKKPNFTKNRIFWEDKEFWKREFLDSELKFNKQKALTFFKGELRTLYLQLNKLFPNYKKSNNGNKQNIIYWEDKEFWLQNFFNYDNTFNLEKSCHFFNVSIACIYKQLRLKIKIPYKRRINVSNKEILLKDFLINLNYELICNSRKILKSLELDIFIPDLNLAIEYNGIYWHSYHPTMYTGLTQIDLNYSKYRHQNKSLACIKKGIRLLHIYEDEDPYIKIEEFLNWKWDGIQSEFDLDSGCDPLNIGFELLEPESKIVLKDRVLWNAGKIKLKGKDSYD